jgi:tRNA-intron endonuclease
MSTKNKPTTETPVVRIEGSLIEKGVLISKKQSIDELTSRGYGVTKGKELLLTFWEALYLLDKQILEIKTENGSKLTFQEMIQAYGKTNENALAGYLVYRDLRGRGYVVREGFGSHVDFRVYERGDYSKGTAKYLIQSVQEGTPMPISDLTTSLTESLSLKKELILAVVNRRGEIVYYSVSELTLK